ncbi:MAG: geranylgeranylglycerol-phosphate geranylgeranyltransferase, partial [Candidatus Ranarchaeia archaeon]
FGALTPVIAVLTTNRFYGLGLPSAVLFRLCLLGYLIYFFVASAGNVVNDIYDIEVDKVNRPNRVLPRGAMTIRQAKIYTFLLSACGAGLAFLISFQAGLVVLVFIAVGIVYAAKAKVAGILGNFAVAISFSFGLIFGGFYTSPNGVIAPVIWFYFGTAATLLAAREIIKGMEDVEGDRIRNVRTIARVYGYKAAASTAIILNTLGIIFFTLVWFLSWSGPFYVYLMIPADAAVFASIVFLLKGFKDPKNQESASRTDKIGAFLGLICFLVGVF